MREAHKIERLPQLLEERSAGVKQSQAFRRYIADRMRDGATDDLGRGISPGERLSCAHHGHSP